MASKSKSKVRIKVPKTKKDLKSFWFTVFVFSTGISLAFTFFTRRG